jgi:FkbM family methyltransferase
VTRPRVRTQPGKKDAAIVPFDFAQRQLATGVEVLTLNHTAMIVTAPEPWSFAVSVPLRQQSANNEPVRLRLKVRVIEGRLVVGVRTRSERLFYSEVLVEAAEDWQTVSIDVPPTQDAGPLIFQNASVAGRSRFSYAVLGGELLAAPTRAQSAPLVAERLLSSLDELTQLAREQDVTLGSARGAFIAAVRGFLEPYRVLLTDRDAMGAIERFIALPDDALCALAEGLASLRPLGFQAGWNSDPRTTTTDLAVFLRARVWEAVAAKCPERAIRLPWHGGTTLALRFGSALSLAIYVAGAFEPNEMTIFDRLLQPGATFIDVGANEGVYSIFAAARVGPKGRVIAVEPSPREIASLRGSLALNPKLKVSVVEAALGQANSWAELHVLDFPHAGENTLASFSTSDTPAIDRRAVPTMSLDSLVQRLPNRKVDVVKIDVEGAELDVLRGAREVLRKQRPALLIEVGGPGDRPKSAVLSMLDKAGYLISTIDDGLGRVVPLAPLDYEHVFNVLAIPKEKHAPLQAALTRTAEV